MRDGDGIACLEGILGGPAASDARVRARAPTAGVHPLALHREGRAWAMCLGRVCDASAPKGPAPGAAELLRRWRRDGAGMLRSIAGEFALAIGDDADGAGLLAVDRFARLPLYWTEAAEGIAFGTSPARVLALVDRSPELSLEAVHAFVYFHVVPAPLSIYAGVQRLENGTAVVLERGSARVLAHWRPAFEESGRFDQARERRTFIAALETAVESAVDEAPSARVGCFLSGGTDSSTIAGLVGRATGERARTFSIGFGVDRYDETRFSRLAARHFDTDHHEYVLTPDDVVEGLRVVASRYEQPFGNSSAVPTHFCARLAAQAGVTRLLGGDGGDELYGGNERYATQALFGLYERVPAAVRTGAIEPALEGALGGIGLLPIRKLRNYVSQARVPLPDRLQARYNLLNHLGREAVFTPALRAAIDADGPAALEREVWSRCDAGAQINRLLAYDFKFTLADNDLPKVVRMCEAAGVEARFPMLHEAVVAHSLSLPPGQKLRGRKLRHFFRESLRGFLPDEIVDKRKQGFGMPFGDWVLAHPVLRAIADDALASIAARGFVNEAFVGAIRDRLRLGHPGYFGTMVWVLTTLELWLRESPLADVRLRD
jgi:asparagine synthase (glutamine-hydrolysing)